MTPLMMGIVFAQIPKQAPFFVRPIVNMIAAGVMAQFIRPRLKQNYGYVEKWLTGKEYFVGSRLSGADSEPPSFPPFLLSFQRLDVSLFVSQS